VFTLIRWAGQRVRAALRLGAVVLCAAVLLPGLLGLPAQTASATRTAAVLQLPNATLIRDTASGRVYLVWAEQRHWIDSPATLTALAYDATTIINLGPDQVATLPNGTELSLHTVAGGLVWPWAPILASPVQLNLAQPSTTVGTYLLVSASGFQPGEPVTISAPNGITAAAVADSQGAFNANVPIPAGVSTGLHHMYAQGAQSGLFGVQVFHVIAAAAAPILNLAPNPVTFGTNLSVSGSGFGPNEQAQIFLNGGMSTVVVSTNASGVFGPASLPVPGNLLPGAYAVQIYGMTSSRWVGDQMPVVAPQPAPTATAVPQANPVVIVSPAVTLPGSQVVISGSGFAPGETVLIRFSGGLVNGINANAAGNFAGVLLTVPSGTGSGTYGITATGATTQRTASTALIVQVPQPVPAGIVISPLSAVPGTQVLIAGTGFQPGEIVLVTFNNQLEESLTASGSGSFTNGYFDVPNTLEPGLYRVMSTGATSGRSATAMLTVSAQPPVMRPSLFASPITIVPGGQVILTGYNFTPGEVVVVRQDKAQVLRFHASAYGSFRVSLTVDAVLGSHTLTATGTTSRKVAVTTVRVAQPINAAIGLAPNRAHRGDVVRVNGGNFFPGEVVLIDFGSTLVQATRADGNGRFANADFTVPGNAPYGITYVNISGSSSVRRAKAALEIIATPPAGAHLKLSSANLHRGSKVTVSGTGYQGGEIVLIRYRGNLVQAATVDSHGNFAKAGFQVPANSPYGTFSVTVTGARSGRSATVKVHVTVTPPSTSILVSPMSVRLDGSITVSGHGFAAGETVLLRLNGKIVQSAKADSHGSFGRTGIKIMPGTRRGYATLLATGARSGRHAQITLWIA